MVSFVIDCVFPSHPRLEMRDVALEVRQLFYPHLDSHLVPMPFLLREAVFFLVMVFAAWTIPPTAFLTGFLDLDLVSAGAK